MTPQGPLETVSGLLNLLLNVSDVPVVVRVGTTLVKVGRISVNESHAVLEMDSAELEVAVEDLLLDRITVAKVQAAQPPEHPTPET